MSPAAALPLPSGDATYPVAGCTDTTHDGLYAVRLGSPDSLEATFVPQGGMTCCSLRHGGVELTAERFGLGAYIDCGVTMGMSIMHPWAGRLSSWSYSACGATVRLPASPLLHTDRWGLPINGVQACGQAWMLRDRGAAAQTAWLQATLPFDRDPRRLELFPFPHRLHTRAQVCGNCLSIHIEVEATGSTPVPVCLGYRIYLRRRPTDSAATVVLPARRRIVTDERLLPTGPTDSLDMSASTLGADALDELFALESDCRLTIASDARRLTLEALDGFQLSHVRSVAGQQHVLVDALTAAPDALSRGTFPVATGERPYRASLRLSVDAFSSDRPRLSS